MLAKVYNSTKAIFTRISSLRGGDQSLATLAHINDLTDRINRNNGGDVVTVTYKADVVSAQNVLVPIHIKNGDVLGPFETPLACDCEDNTPGKSKRKIKEYSNGMNGCIACWRKDNIAIATEASYFGVVLKSPADSSEYPALSDFTMRWAHINPAYNVGLEKVSQYAFRIKVYDIANGVYVTSWPTGLQIDITFYNGTVTES